MFLFLFERQAEPPVTQRDKPGTVDCCIISVKPLAANG